MFEKNNHAPLSRDETRNVLSHRDEMAIKKMWDTILYRAG